MLCRAFNRLMLAIDDSAITVFICSFSASRLNGFRLPPFFECFLDDESLVSEENKPVLLLPPPPPGSDVDREGLWEGPAEEDEAVDVVVVVAAASAARRVASSSSSSPNGFSSVSRMTLDRCWVTPTLRLGSSCQTCQCPFAPLFVEEQPSC
jgi:hypothetical protein